jgi:hypothetical protein
MSAKSSIIAYAPTASSADLCSLCRELVLATQPTKHTAPLKPFRCAMLIKSLAIANFVASAFRAAHSAGVHQA